jgi:uncharacterized protein YaiI (UPF0178 family)
LPEPRILVDADACPVKDDIYRVAVRNAVPVVIVSNSGLRLPAHPLITQIMVSDRFDAADDWIVEHTDAATLVITGDILLADRCLKAGASVLAHNGRPFTTSSIGAAIATRAIMAELRAGGDVVPGGPSAFSKDDRARFLQALDAALVKLKGLRRPGSGQG